MLLRSLASALINFYNLIRDTLFLVGDVLFPFVFVMFFIGSALALYQGREYKRYFVFFAVFLVFSSSILGVYLIPAPHAQRYSDIQDQTKSVHAIAMVDSNGKEIILDDRATNPVGSGPLGRELVNNITNDSDRVNYAEKIIDDSETYRQDVISSYPRVSHPPVSAGPLWDRERINRYSEFAGVKIYQFTVMFESESHHIDNISKECILEIDTKEGEVYEQC